MEVDPGWPPAYAREGDLGQWLGARATLGRWVAIGSREEPVGHVGIAPVAPGEAAELWTGFLGCEIGALAEVCRNLVKPGMRKNGVSTALTRVALRAAIDAGRVPVAAVLHDRHASLAMMLSAGWRSLGNVTGRSGRELSVMIPGPRVLAAAQAGRVTRPRLEASSPAAASAESRSRTAEARIASSRQAPASRAPRIYAHAATSIELESYRACKGPVLPHQAERALLLAQPGDLVCLEEPVDPAFLEFLSRLGLGPLPEHVVVANRCAPSDAALPDRLRRDDATLHSMAAALPKDRVVHLDPFIATSGEERLIRTLRTQCAVQVVMDAPRAGLVERCNRKHEVRPLAEGLGLPIADGEVVALDGPPDHPPRDIAPLESAIARVLSRAARVIVRASESAGGSGTFLVDRDAGSLETTLAEVSKRRDNRFYLVEERVEASVSPNVLLYIPSSSEPIRCIGVTDQVLDERLAHRGNRFPSAACCADSMRRDAMRLARVLRDQGYRGFAGLDFVECRHPRSPRSRYLFVELNPRVNGALYPLYARERLNATPERRGRFNIDAFVSRSLRTRPTSFQAVAALTRDLLFDRDRGSGVLPYKTGAFGLGLVTAVALAPSLEEAEQLSSEFASRLAVR